MPRARSCLVVMCGLPAAGKTTVAEQLCDHVQRLTISKVQAHHVCLDKLLSESMAASSQGDHAFCSMIWQEARAKMIQRVKDLLERQSGIAAGRSSGESAADCGPGTTKHERCAHEGRSSSEEKVQDHGRLTTEATLQPEDDQDGRGRDVSEQSTEDQRTLVVVDDNMYFRSMRHEMLILARQYCSAFVVVYMKCSVQQACARNELRDASRRVPEQCIHDMAAKLEPPDGDRYEWEKPCVCLPADYGKVEGPPSVDVLEECRSAGQCRSSGHCRALAQVPMLWQRIWKLWGDPPLKPKSQEEAAVRREEGRAANARSIAHTMDLWSRKKISSTIQRLSATGNDTLRAKAVEQLREARGRLLADVRCFGGNAAAFDQPSPRLEAVAHGPVSKLAAIKLQFEVFCDNIESTVGLTG